MESPLIGFWQMIGTYLIVLLTLYGLFVGDKTKKEIRVKTKEGFISGWEAGGKVWEGIKRRKFYIVVLLLLLLFLYVMHISDELNQVKKNVSELDIRTEELRSDYKIIQTKYDSIDSLNIALVEIDKRRDSLLIVEKENNVDLTAEISDLDSAILNLKGQIITVTGNISVLWEKVNEKEKEIDSLKKESKKLGVIIRNQQKDDSLKSRKIDSLITALNTKTDFLVTSMSIETYMDGHLDIDYDIERTKTAKKIKQARITFTLNNELSAKDVVFVRIDNYEYFHVLSTNNKKMLSDSIYFVDFKIRKGEKLVPGNLYAKVYYNNEVLSTDSITLL